MKITIEIDAGTLKDIQHLTGIRQRSPAVSRAAEEFVRAERRRRLVQRALDGEMDYSLSNDEVESLVDHDAR